MRSPRGIELLIDSFHGFPQLAVEDCLGWESLFLVTEDLVAVPIDPKTVLPEIILNWGTLTPAEFNLISLKLRAKYSKEALSKVASTRITRFEYEAPENLEVVPWWVSTEPLKQFMVPKSRVSIRELEQFSQTFTLHGHFKEFIPHMSAFHLDAEILEDYRNQFQGAWLAAKATGNPQVVQGEAPGLFVIYPEGNAFWAIGHSLYSFMTEGELRIHEAKIALTNKEISLDEYKSVLRENGGK